MYSSQYSTPWLTDKGEIIDYSNNIIYTNVNKLKSTYFKSFVDISGDLIIRSGRVYNDYLAGLFSNINNTLFIYNTISGITYTSNNLNNYVTISNYLYYNGQNNQTINGLTNSITNINNTLFTYITLSGITYTTNNYLTISGYNYNIQNFVTTTALNSYLQLNTLSSYVTLSNFNNTLLNYLTISSYNINTPKYTLNTNVSSITIGGTTLNANNQTITIPYNNVGTNNYNLTGLTPSFLNGNYVISSSGSYIGSQPYRYDYYAFDGISGTFFQTYLAFNIKPTTTLYDYITSYSGAYLQISLPYNLILTSYQLSGPSSTNFPNSLVVLGSSDNSTWYLIDTQAPTTNFTTTYTLSTTTSYYKYFRMILLSYNGGTVGQINEWKLTGTYIDTTCLYVSNKLYTPYINNVSATTLSYLDASSSIQTQFNTLNTNVNSLTTTVNALPSFSLASYATVASVSNAITITDDATISSNISTGFTEITYGSDYYIFANGLKTSDIFLTSLNSKLSQYFSNYQTNLISTSVININSLTCSTITTTANINGISPSIFGFLTGITSNVQTQLNSITTNYVSNNSLTTTLNGYVTSSSLGTTLGSYVTTTNANNTYLLITSYQTLIAAYTNTANLQSFNFSGNPIITSTQLGVGDNGTNIATTAWVKSLSYANSASFSLYTPTFNLASFSFTGNPKITSAILALSDNTTNIPTAAWVKSVLASYVTTSSLSTTLNSYTTTANLASFAFTGNPIISSALLSSLDNSQYIPTTNWVKTVLGSYSLSTALNSYTTTANLASFSFSGNPIITATELAYNDTSTKIPTAKWVSDYFLSVSAFNTSIGSYTTTANLASFNFVGNPIITAPQLANTDNSQYISTTAWVKSVLNSYALSNLYTTTTNLASFIFTGTPQITSTPILTSDSSTLIPTTAWVKSVLGSYVLSTALNLYTTTTNLASFIFTGNPTITSPELASTDASTKIPTSKWVSDYFLSTSSASATYATIANSVTNSSLATTLNSYLTSTSASSIYKSISDFNTDIANYVTSSSLVTALGPYMTTASAQSAFQPILTSTSNISCNNVNINGYIVLPCFVRTNGTLFSVGNLNNTLLTFPTLIYYLGNSAISYSAGNFTNSSSVMTSCNVTVRIPWVAGPNGIRSAFILHSNTGYGRMGESTVSNQGTSAPCVLNVSANVILASGEYFQVYLYQSSGAPLTLSNTSGQLTTISIR